MYIGYDKYHTLQKIRATFLSLSDEKKATSAGLKRLGFSCRPLAYSLSMGEVVENGYRIWIRDGYTEAEEEDQGPLL